MCVYSCLKLDCERKEDELRIVSIKGCADRTWCLDVNFSVRHSDSDRTQINIQQQWQHLDKEMKHGS